MYLREVIHDRPLMCVRVCAGIWLVLWYGTTTRGTKAGVFFKSPLNHEYSSTIDSKNTVLQDNQFAVMNVSLPQQTPILIVLYRQNSDFGVQIHLKNWKHIKINHSTSEKKWYGLEFVFAPLFLSCFQKLLHLTNSQVDKKQGFLIYNPGIVKLVLCL